MALGVFFFFFLALMAAAFLAARSDPRLGLVEGEGDTLEEAGDAGAAGVKNILFEEVSGDGDTDSSMSQFSRLMSSCLELLGSRV